MENTFGIFKTISEKYRDLIKEEALYYNDTTAMYDRATVDYTDKDDIISQAFAYGGPVLELCCGTGRITLPLLKKRFKVTAVDLSKDMLDVLKRSVEDNKIYSKYRDNLKIVHGDMNEIDTKEKYNFVVIGATSIRLMENDFTEFFNKIYDVLNDNGGFFFDFEDLPVKEGAVVETEPMIITDVEMGEGKMALEIVQRKKDHINKRTYVNMLEIKIPGNEKLLLSYTGYRMFGKDDIEKAAEKSRFKGCRLTRRPDGIWNCIMTKGKN